MLSNILFYKQRMKDWFQKQGHWLIFLIFSLVLLVYQWDQKKTERVKSLPTEQELLLKEDLATEDFYNGKNQKRETFSSTKKAQHLSQNSVDTVIPSGYVLIPIEVQNFAAVNALLGPFGVVDLFVYEGSKARLIAHQVKIIRAPLDPSHFAVLVPEQESQRVLQFEGPYTVVVQNPKKQEIRFQRIENKKIKRIVYEEE